MGRKLGAVPRFWGGAGSSSNTKSPGLRPTSVPSGILMHPSNRLATIEIGRKFGRGLRRLFWEGRWVPIEHSVAWTTAHLRTKCRLDLSNRLTTKDMSRKLGRRFSPLFWRGELGPHLTQCGQGRGLPARQVSSGSIQPFGHNTPTSQTNRTVRQGRQDRTTIG